MEARRLFKIFDSNKGAAQDTSPHNLAPGPIKHVKLNRCFQMAEAGRPPRLPRLSFLPYDRSVNSHGLLPNPGDCEYCRSEPGLRMSF